jgi:DNA-binding NtrC family response regulator
MSTVLCACSESLHTRRPVLTSAGFDVLIASTKDELLTAGRSPQVNAVVLDSRSPICDLPAVAADLKKVHPSLPVLLVTDAGVDDVPQPAAVFDRVLSRLEGPSALLRSLHELTAGVVSISEATTYSAAETYARVREMRHHVAQLKLKMSHLRQKLWSRG